MSEQSSVQAELKKLASMLAVPVTDLIFLDQLDMAQLRYLGTAVNQAMQAEQAPLWATLARARPGQLSRQLSLEEAAHAAETLKQLSLETALNPIWEAITSP
ncbi:MAG: hypothetical protein R3E31_15800 [Chloroflexota bacterium]|nr:hypothetical protein [Ardenticatenaceae bacterium]